MSRWPVLALVTLAHALGALSVLAVAPLSPFLLDALQLSRAQVGLLLPAVSLGGGLLVIGALLLTAAATHTLASLLGALVLAGFGFSVLNPSTGKAVVEW